MPLSVLDVADEELGRVNLDSIACLMANLCAEKSFLSSPDAADLSLSLFLPCSEAKPFESLPSSTSSSDPKREAIQLDASF
jgi:hypothetical protein